MTVNPLNREELQPLINQQEASRPLSQRRVAVLCAANVCRETGVLAMLPHGTERLQHLHTLAGHRS